MITRGRGVVARRRPPDPRRGRVACDSWNALALSSVGADIPAMEERAATPHRIAVAAALFGVKTRATLRNPNGVERSVLIRACGRRHILSQGGVLYEGELRCRQRPCPLCARRRASQNGYALAAAVQHYRSVRPDVLFAFATLTQRKQPRSREGALAALERIKDSYRRLTDTRKPIGKDFYRYFRGGLRSIETTWSETKYSGFHPHLHIILEIREGVSHAKACTWLTNAWLSVSEGSEHVAQLVRPTHGDDLRDLTKYVTKPLEDCSGKPSIMRELFDALNGQRLLQAFGEWQGRGDRLGWRAIGEAAANANNGYVKREGVLYRGPEIGHVLRFVSKPIEGTTGRIMLVAAGGNDVIRVHADVAWTTIESEYKARAIADEARARARDDKQPPKENNHATHDQLAPARRHSRPPRGGLLEPTPERRHTVERLE